MIPETPGKVTHGIGPEESNGVEAGWHEDCTSLPPVTEDWENKECQENLNSTAWQRTQVEEQGDGSQEPEA